MVEFAVHLFSKLYEYNFRKYWFQNLTSVCRNIPFFKYTREKSLIP